MSADFSVSFKSRANPSAARAIIKLVSFVVFIQHFENLVHSSVREDISVIIGGVPVLFVMESSTQQQSGPRPSQLH